MLGTRMEIKARERLCPLSCAHRRPIKVARLLARRATQA
jgi:hypothetical protein